MANGDGVIKSEDPQWKRHGLDLIGEALALHEHYTLVQSLWTALKFPHHCCDIAKIVGDIRRLELEMGLEDNWDC